MAVSKGEGNALICVISKHGMMTHGAERYAGSREERLEHPLVLLSVALLSARLSIQSCPIQVWNNSHLKRQVYKFQVADEQRSPDGD